MSSVSTAPGGLVRARNVHKTFSRGSERINVLQGVNVDVPAGEFLAPMGPSGSGKTTLLNLIGGLDSPTSGTIEVGGVDISRLGGAALSRWRARAVLTSAPVCAAPVRCCARTSIRGGETT